MAANTRRLALIIFFMAATLLSMIGLEREVGASIYNLADDAAAFGNQKLSNHYFSAGTAFLQQKRTLTSKVPQLKEDSKLSSDPQQISEPAQDASKLAITDKRDQSMDRSIQASVTAFITKMRQEPMVGPGQVVKPQSRLEILMGGSTWLIFVSLLALLWQKYGQLEVDDVSMLEEQTETHGFQFGLFDTTNCSIQLALASACCCFIVWPTTVSHSRLKLTTFWPAFFAMAVLLAYNGLLGGLLGLFLGCLVVYCRQKIRAHYKLESNTFFTVMEDCLLWCCCPCCTAAQEYRQVQYVKAKGAS